MSTGPFESEREAREAADRWPVEGKANENPNLTMMLDACLGAGVQLGAYDRKLLSWMAGWPPATCAVVASLIARAHQAGVQHAAGFRPMDTDDIDPETGEAQ